MEGLIQNIPLEYKNIGIKISGGADSAIVCYALAKYIFDNNNHHKIVPITVNHSGKSYQLEFAKRVVNFCKEQFGNIFLEHQYAWCETGDEYVSTQDNLVNSLYRNNEIQCHFVGITQNPPADVMEVIGWNGPADDRSPGTVRPTSKGTGYYPLVNTNKQGVRDWYNFYNVVDDLFPLTRSCENFTENFETHCGECWFCKERYWGFGRYE